MKTLAERARTVKIKLLIACCLSTLLGVVCFLREYLFLGGVAWGLAIANVVTFTRLQILSRRRE